MDQRLNSIVAFLLDLDIDCRICENDQARISFGIRYPWTVSLILRDRLSFFSCLADSIPEESAKAARKACKYIEKTAGLPCRILMGKVWLWYIFGDIAPGDEGPFVAKKLVYFKEAMDFAIPQLIFALESSLIDRAFLAVSEAYYCMKEMPIHLTDWEESELYQQMKRRRFMAEIRTLGVLTLDTRGNPAAQKAPAKPDHESELPALQNTNRKTRERKGRTPCLRSILLAYLSILTLMVFALQVQWALSPYGGPQQFFFGVRREILVYGVMACWFCLFVPAKMHGKSRVAAGLITATAALLYTGLIILLNNAWHLLGYLKDLIAYRTHGFNDSLLFVYRQIVKEDLLYHAGLAEFRYPLVFSVITALILLRYYMRYSAKRKWINRLRARGQGGSAFWLRFPMP